MDSVQSVFVVEMCGGRKPGSTNEAYRLTLCDALAHSGRLGKAGHMRVQSSDIAAMLENNGVAVAAFHATKYDLAIARCLNRCAFRRCVVNASVGADRIQNRVPPIGVKARAYAREIDRCTE